MPWVGFELMIPVFERVKTVHALERAATEIGPHLHLVPRLSMRVYTPLLPVQSLRA
jgi:hypothetical protein